MTKEHILIILSDCWADLLYYDRKEDDDCQVGDIENAIKNGVITVDEMVDEMVDSFRRQIENNLKG